MIKVSRICRKYEKNERIYGTKEELFRFLKWYTLKVGCYIKEKKVVILNLPSKDEREVKYLENDMLTIQDVLQILKKRILLIAIITIMTIGATALINEKVLVPQYRTSMQLYIGKDTNEGTQGYNSSELSLYQQLMTTYAGFFQSEDVIARAIKDKNIGMTVGEIKSSLSVAISDKDRFLTTSIVTLDPNKGKEVLEVITEEFMKTSTEFIPNGTVQVLNTPKVPSGPFSPNKPMNILVSLVIGFMVSVTLSLFLEYLDNSVKKKDDIEKLLGVPVIGMVPEFNEKVFEKEKKQRQIRDKKISNSNNTQNEIANLVAAKEVSVDIDTDVKAEITATVIGDLEDGKDDIQDENTRTGRRSKGAKRRTRT